MSGGVQIGLGLGSNLGRKADNIRLAASRLVETGLVRDLVLSSLYRTPPWGHVTEQDWFVNACATAVTDVEPTALLAGVKALEREIGRTETVRWGPRVIDIDILYYGDAALDTPDLTLPHKELLNRAFVLVPLSELQPNLHVGGCRLGQAIAALGPQQIERLQDA